MKGIDRSRKKINEIERLLAEVKDKLKNLQKGELSQQKNKVADNKTLLEEEFKVRQEYEMPATESLPSELEFKNEYEKLYEEFMERNFESVKNFIRGKSKNYLKAFCKSNNLPVDATKASKDRIAEEVMQWMARRNAISKKLT